jgi:hypothetical protein
MTCGRVKDIGLIFLYLPHPLEGLYYKMKNGSPPFTMERRQGVR